MGLISVLFGRKKDDSPDVLGRYPEYMQVPALPERRYLKTSRLLALFIFLNMAVMIAVAGFFTYNADRIDISIANRRVVNLFSIDSSRQVLIPAEYATKNVTALELFSESLLRDYIYNRHTLTWENKEMQLRWDVGGPVSGYSNHKRVYMPFRVSADNLFQESRTRGFVRDVHIYELKRIKQNLWEAVIDTFDMPIPDAYNPLCDCSDNSKKCIACKTKYTSRQLRYRILIRTSFNGVKTVLNPLGFRVETYNMLYVPVKDKETFWRVPNDLKPEY